MAPLSKAGLTVPGLCRVDLGDRVLILAGHRGAPPELTYVGACKKMEGVDGDYT
jgi:hypothetical protein